MNSNFPNISIFESITPTELDYGQIKTQEFTLLTISRHLFNERLDISGTARHQRIVSFLVVMKYWPVELSSRKTRNANNGGDVDGSPTWTVREMGSFHPAFISGFLKVTIERKDIPIIAINYPVMANRAYGEILN